MRLIAFAPMLAIVAYGQVPVDSKPTRDKGVRLEGVAWPEAQSLLQADTLVVLPVGPAAKEHGPHLRLRTDLDLAEYLTRRVLEAASVVAAPPLTYHYDPAFLDYPGSTSLSLAAARDLTSDVVRSLSRYGPRRFYALNTGTGTARALEAAARGLAAEGILLRYTDFAVRLDQASRAVRKQEPIGHADELETSMMLFIEPGSVDMTKAAKDFAPAGGAPLRLTPRRGGAGTYSPSGVWGDPTLADRDKGRIVLQGLVAAILQDIEETRRAALPLATSPAPLSGPGAPGRPSASEPPQQPGRCTPGDERTIRGIGDSFAAAWVNGDAAALGNLWSADGDIMHPDGTFERSAQVITQNRAELFLRRQYRGTRHPLMLGMVRCLTPDVAIADGKWELRGVTDANGQPVPTMEGFCTLVVKRNRGAWLIEAYRYTMKPPAAGTTPPALQQRPGWPVIK